MKKYTFYFRAIGPKILTSLYISAIIIVTATIGASLMKHYFLALCSALALTACGGGGGGSTQPVSTPTTQVQYSTASYDNVKKLNTYYNDGWPDNRGSLGTAQFKFNDGTDGLIIAGLNYNVTQSTPSTAQPGFVNLYKRNNGAWQQQNLIDTGAVNNCIHPRKSLPADINKDGQIDFIILCHGYDAAPFPGERSRVLLSQPNGHYVLDYMSADVNFWHGGATYDLNGDGYADLLASAFDGVRAFINDGTGHFNYSAEYSIVGLSGVFIVEITDVNGDGKYDLLYGGHEWDRPTTVVINPGNNKFSNGNVISIPAMAGQGTVLDFVYTSANNSIYVLRTGGDAAFANFYQGVYVQKYSLTSGISSTVVNNPGYRESRPGASSYMTWMPWLDEQDGYITSDWGSVFHIQVQ